MIQRSFYEAGEAGKTKNFFQLRENYLNFHFQKRKFGLPASSFKGIFGIFRAKEGQNGVLF